MRRLAAILLLLLISSASSGAPPRPFLVIVHPDNPMDRVDERFLGRAFLKKVTQWPDGESIRPIDLPPSSPVRRSFVEQVLDRSIGAVRNYWQQLLFAGRALPPPELDSEEAVVEYVLRHRGAVGYVSPHTAVGPAKVLLVE